MDSIDLIVVFTRKRERRFAQIKKINMILLIYIMISSEIFKSLLQSVVHDFRIYLCVIVQPTSMGYFDNKLC